jgi:hypothetical protein
MAMRLRAILLALIALTWMMQAPEALAQQNVKCNRAAVYDASTSGSTLLVTGISTANINICGFDFFAGGTVNVKLVRGTGATCGTGTVDLTPAFQFTAQTGLVDPGIESRGLFAGPSQNLCINASGATAVQAIVYYSQK